MTSIIHPAIEQIYSHNQQFATTYRHYGSMLDYWTREGVISSSHFGGKRVLDWECGYGVFAALFVEHGAASVIAIDSWLDTEYVQRSFGDLPQIAFHRLALQEFAEDSANHSAFDLIFANTVTEHMLDLPRLLTLCYELLAPNGILFINHDNYYQPVGSHDHGFLGYGQTGEVIFLGPRCWEHAEKCEVSQKFRASIAERLPWSWNAWSDLQRSPENCALCPYYRRAQPWAHLRYQQDFRQTFPQQCFTTGYKFSTLNKITPFQLRQFLIEAGFDIECWVAQHVRNEPPPELLQPPFNFNLNDLCTSTVAIRCRKGSLPSYRIVEN